MKNNPVLQERREFLKTLSKAGLSLAALQGSALTAGMMLGRSALAQNASAIKRVVCVFIPDGAPTRNGRSLFVPSADMVLPAASATLETVKQHCVFFNDALVSNSSFAGTGGHGNSSKGLGGDGRRNSYDVELERTLGANTPFPSVLLGVQSTEGGHGYASKKDGQEIIYQDNPIAAFNRLFGSNTPVGSIASKRAQGVLDIHKEELAELQRRLGAAEKERLDEHLASVLKIEERLREQVNNEAVPGCVNPQWNTQNFTYDPADKTTFDRVSALQMDTAVLALKCNFTRVVSLMLGNHQAEHAVAESGYNGSYHQSIHGGTTETFSQTRAYLSGRLAYLIQQLAAATDEFGNSLLNSTLVVQVTDMADGNAHDSENAPFVLAGGGSAVRGGRVLSCGPHLNIFDTMTELLGLNAVVPRFGQGAITGVIA